MPAVSETMIDALQRLSGEIVYLCEAEEREASIEIFRELQRIKQEIAALTPLLLDHCLRKKVAALSQDELHLAEGKVAEIVEIFMLAQNMLCPSCRELFSTMLTREQSTANQGESSGAITHV